MDIYEQKRAHALQLANRKRTGSRLSFFAHWARIIIVSLALFVVIRAFGVEAFKIASGSMEHTLFEGDFLLMTTLSSEVIAAISLIRGIGGSWPTLLCAASR